MTDFDGLLLVVICISVAFAAYRGAIRETATLAAVLIAALFAWSLTGPILSLLGRPESFVSVAAVWGGLGAAAFIVLYVAVARFTGRLRLTPGLAALDRIAGAAFGGARALLLIGLGFVAYGYYLDAEDRPESVRNAALLPLAERAAAAIDSVAPARPALDAADPAVPADAAAGGAAPDEDAAESAEGEAAGAAETAASYPRGSRSGLKELVTTLTTTEPTPTAAEPAPGAAPDTAPADPLGALAAEATAAPSDRR